MKPIRIERWACKRSGGTYSAPETTGLCLRGEVFGHPDARFTDGDRVTTGPIVEVNGRTVQTRSGHLYQLGEPDSRYLEWLKDEGIPFDPEQPIRVRVRGVS